MIFTSMDAMRESPEGVELLLWNGLKMASRRKEWFMKGRTKKGDLVTLAPVVILLVPVKIKLKLHRLRSVGGEYDSKEYKLFFSQSVVYTCTLSEMFSLIV